MDDTFQQQQMRDQHNRSIIERSYRSFFAVGLHANPDSLLTSGTLEDRAKYVKALRMRAVKFVVLCVIFGMVYWLTPSKPPQVIPPPVVTQAGVVHSILLRETAFSTSTSVETSEGTFQVRGAVTATPGDHVEMMVEIDHGVKGTSLCIASKFKTACYSLM